MSSTSPPLPVPPTPNSRTAKKWKLIFIGLGVAIIVLLVCSYFLFRYVIATGITRGFDNQFGDQHLTTPVALIELHKVRYGRYPESLRDLRFEGDWDQIWLNGMSYYPNSDRTAYYVEVERGWIGKPDLQMPPEFWQGTGYSPQLKPPTQ
jgi:hypothetical protein